MASRETDEKLASVFLWRIENLSYFDPELHGRGITSPQFASVNLPGMSFNLQLCPRGKNGGDSNLVLGLYTLYEQNSELDLEWSFLDADGSPLVTGFLQNWKQEDCSLLALPDCPTQEDVFLTRKSSFLPHDTLTVRCRILDPIRDFPHAEHISAVSQIEVLEETLIWRIKEFSALQLGEEVNTNLQLSNNNRIKNNVLLKFSLTGTSLDDSRVQVEIASNYLPYQLRIKLFISDKEKKSEKCVQQSCEFLSDAVNQIWIVPQFLSRQEILESSSIWLCGDDLILLCKFTILPTIIYKSIENSYHGPENLKINIPNKTSSVTKSESKELIGTKPNMIYHQQKALEILVEDLMSMYQEHILSDFELRSGDVSFPVHKAVLSARSPVFKAMFSGNMQEANSDFLVVPDVNPHTLRRMLTFLYSGTIDTLQWEDAAKLYYAADKYQVQSLKRECSSLLKSNISVSNVSHVLELADRHQDQDLTSFVHDFILNHFDEIVMSSEWNLFMTRTPLAGKTIVNVYKMKLQRKTDAIL